MVTITKRSKESKPKKTKIQVGDVLGDMTVVGIEKYVDRNSGNKDGIMSVRIVIVRSVSIITILFRAAAVNQNLSIKRFLL